MKRALTFGLSILFIPLFALAQNEESPPGFNESTFKGLEMRGVGPALMSGRISDLVIHPNDPSTQISRFPAPDLRHLRLESLDVVGA